MLAKVSLLVELFAPEGLDTVHICRCGCILVPVDGPAVVVVVAGMAGDKAGAVFNRERFIRSGSKRLGIHCILLLLDVEEQGETRYGKAGGNVEVHCHLSPLDGSHIILRINRQGEGSSQRDDDRSCEAAGVLEHYGLLPHFTGLETLRVRT